MPACLVTATLDPDAGFDLEAAVNTFAFGSDVPLDAAVRLDILNAVASFYTAVPTGGANAVGKYLNGAFTRAVGGCSLKMYDITGHMDGSPHGSPIDEGTFTLPAALTIDAAPTQIATVLTLRARNALEEPVEGPADTRPRQRKTGRIYVGSLNMAAVDTAGAGGARPILAFRNELLRAAEDLQDALVDGDYAWGVWSRTDDEIVPITRVEVDDSFDVLRSRKLAPTVRLNRTFAPAPGLVLGA